MAVDNKQIATDVLELVGGAENVTVATNCMTRLRLTLKDNNKAGFEATCFFLAKLCEQGELLRRWEGQTRGPVLSEQYFRVHLAPRDVYRAKDAIVTTSRIGFAREAEEEHDVDLGLVELQKKTESP